jgi:cell division protein FtsQ
MTVELDERGAVAPVRIHPRIWNRRVEVTRERGRKRLRVAVGLLSALAVPALGFGAVHSPLFSARNLDVEGAVHTPAAQVLRASGLEDHPPLVDIDADEMDRSIESLPWVATASVQVHWPDSVTVRVKERAPLGAVGPVRSHGRTTWSLVDVSGRVLAVAGSAPRGVLRLSVPVKPGAAGSTLSWTDRPAVVVSATLPRAISARTESVDQDLAGSVSLELTGGVTAALGAPTALSQKYQALSSVLEGVTLASGDVVNVTVPEEPTVAAS